MTATATASAWKSPSHSHSHSRSSRPSTTPRAYDGAMSVGQAMPPLLSPHNKSPQTAKHIRSPDAGYFGFVVNDESIPPDSNPGLHVRQNWNLSHSSAGSVTVPKQPSNERMPEFEAFRKRSEQYHNFNLSNNNLASLRAGSQSNTPQLKSKRSDESPQSPNPKRPSQMRPESSRASGLNSKMDSIFFDIPRNESPSPISSPNTVADHQHARLSLPASEIQSQLETLQKQRSHTLPQVENSAPNMASVHEVAQILRTNSDDVLLFDLRVYQQYATSRIHGALNLCLPTTLLKRPTFTVQKLAETFTSAHDKDEFEKWQDCKYIVVYDGNSMQAKEAIMPFNVLKKFSSEGWNGRGLVITGGYMTFAKHFPQLIDQGPVRKGKGSSARLTSPSLAADNAIPVAGGCSMPETKSAANPFFGNIRQNMDLLDGVGQMPIEKPTSMTESDVKRLPRWLREASQSSDEGKKVSSKFLDIERSEQRRMQQALSGEVQYGTPHAEKSKHIQVAGIEKGAKNRYNNIFPFEHTRVKLQDVPSYGCDYVNANFVKAAYSNRKYIATQAPIPATFEDFWRVIWEQDVRVVVMLTAEAEGGQIKSHPYWNSGEYGQFKVKNLSERSVHLDKRSKEKEAARPQMAPRRSTQPHTMGEKRSAVEHKPLIEPESPVATIRHFTLSHKDQPFKPMHEITQVHYTQWPDFGAPANPTAILGLIDLVNKYIRQSAAVAIRPESAAPSDERPIVVHCSAGCGRTGTYCTIDSVIDMLKRQKLERGKHRSYEDEMDVDIPDNWISRDDIDLVAKAVNDFRHQRLSMVQNLRQFVLCYESIIQWIMAQQNDDPRSKYMREGSRRSYQGTAGS
ncbi:hypothetical protein R6Q59_009872 [Mikania micrantha]